MPTTAHCPNCGYALPTGRARVCLACYAWVESLPEGTPDGSPQPVPGSTRAGAAAAVLLFAGVVAAIRGASVALDGTGDHPMPLFVVAAGLVACAVLAWLVGALPRR